VYINVFVPTTYRPQNNRNFRKTHDRSRSDKTIDPSRRRRSSRWVDWNTSCNGSSPFFFTERLLRSITGTIYVENVTRARDGTFWPPAHAQCPGRRRRTAFRAFCFQCRQPRGNVRVCTFVFMCQRSSIGVTLVSPLCHYVLGTGAVCFFHYVPSAHAK